MRYGVWLINKFRCIPKLCSRIVKCAQRLIWGIPAFRNGVSIYWISLAQLFVYNHTNRRGLSENGSSIGSFESFAKSLHAKTWKSFVDVNYLVAVSTIGKAFVRRRSYDWHSWTIHNSIRFSATRKSLIWSGNSAKESA